MSWARGKCDEVRGNGVVGGGKCDGCGAWNSGEVGANRWKYQVWGGGQGEV